MLKDKFRRLYALALDKECLISQRRVNLESVWDWRRPLRGGIEDSQLGDLINILCDYNFSNENNWWIWNLNGSRNFLVRDLRICIDQVYLPTGDRNTRWNKLVPRKVNILVWRLLLDRLPTRFNLVNRGLDIPSILCPICSNHAETAIHLLA